MSYISNGRRRSTAVTQYTLYLTTASLLPVIRPLLGRQDWPLSHPMQVLFLTVFEHCEEKLFKYCLNTSHYYVVYRNAGMIVLINSNNL